MPKIVTIDTGQQLIDIEVDDSFVGETEPIKQEPIKDKAKNKLFEALKVPEQKAKEGLEALTKKGVNLQNIVAEKTGLPIGTEPTGEPFRDIAANIPRIAGETLSETAPGFVSPVAIAAGGVFNPATGKLAKAAAPAAKQLVKYIGKNLEEISGLTYKTPGVLGEAFRDPTLFFAKGKEAAGKLYEAAKAEMPKGLNVFGNMYKAEKIIDTALDFIQNGGKLEPAESLMARKAVDSLLKKPGYIKDELISLRKVFDEATKVSPEMSLADKVFARGLKAEQMRRFLPINKTGTPSLVKGGVMALLPKILVPLMSPAVHGLAASGAGAAFKVGKAAAGSTPRIAAISKPALKSIRDLMREEQ